MENYNDRLANHLRRISPSRLAIIVVAIFVSLLGIVLFIYVSRSTKVPVRIEYAPYAATVKLNGSKVKNRTDHYLKPGTYMVSVEFENFQSIEKEIIIDEETIMLSDALTPTNEAGVSYMTEHQSEFNSIKDNADALNSIAERRLKERAEKEAPITTHLPFKNALFSLDYSVEDDHVVVFVSASTTYLDLAVNKLNTFLSDGESLSSYDIRFEDSGVSELEVAQGVATLNDPSKSLEALLGGNSAFRIVKDGRSEDYYYAVFTTGTAETYSLATYRAILKREGGTWTLHSSPSPILTVYNSKGVSVELLDAVNNLN